MRPVDAWCLLLTMFSPMAPVGRFSIRLMCLHSWLVKVILLGLRTPGPIIQIDLVWSPSGLLAWPRLRTVVVIAITVLTTFLGALRLLSSIVLAATRRFMPCISRMVWFGRAVGWFRGLRQLTLGPRCWATAWLFPLKALVRLLCTRFS